MIRMRLAVLALAITVACAGAVAKVGEITVRTGGGGTVSRVELPGGLVGYALPRDGAGNQEIIALVGPSMDRPKEDPDRPEVIRGAEGVPAHTLPVEGLHLFRFDPTRKGPLELLDVEVLEGSSAVAAIDLDGDGVDEVLLGARSGLYVLERSAGGSWVLREEPLLTGEEIGTPGTDSLSLTVRAGRPCLVSAGFLRCYGPSEDGNRYVSLGEAPLPIKATQQRFSLSVRSPAVRAAGTWTDGPVKFATVPEPFGSKRIRTYLLDPEAPDDERGVECWGSFPGSEELMEHGFVLFDDGLALVVATRNADKLALFGEKRIRLYYPKPDRTRRGHPPEFAVESRINLWQPAQFMSLDVTADGREDLVVAYWKGLRDDRVVLDVYPRTADGGFSQKVGTTGFDVKDGERSFVGYGHDLDGDGLYDLVVTAKQSVLIYRGRPSPKGEKVVNKDPVVFSEIDRAHRGEVEVFVGPPGSGEFSMRVVLPPRFADVDGDGREEVLFVGGDRRGTSVLTVVGLD
jgi:hypothetical protein